MLQLSFCGIYLIHHSHKVLSHHGFNLTICPSTVKEFDNLLLLARLQDPYEVARLWNHMLKEQGSLTRFGYLLASSSPITVVYIPSKSEAIPT